MGVQSECVTPKKNSSSFMCWDFMWYWIIMHVRMFSQVLQRVLFFRTFSYFWWSLKHAFMRITHFGWFPLSLIRQAFVVFRQSLIVSCHSLSGVLYQSRSPSHINSARIWCVRKFGFLVLFYILIRKQDGSRYSKRKWSCRQVTQNI